MTLLVGFGAIGKGASVVRGELDRFVEILDGAVVVALFQESYAAVVERLREARVVFDRCVIVAYGVLEITLCGIGVAAIGMRDRQDQGRFFSGFNERRATLDLRVRRSAVDAIAQLNVFQL